MKKQEEFELIIAIVKSGFSDYVIEASKDAGGKGATIISGRGVSGHTQENIFGVNIQPEKEVVLILVPKQERTKIMKEICSRANLDQEGKGICFSVPVDDIAGVSHFFAKQEIEQN